MHIIAFFLPVFVDDNFESFRFAKDLMMTLLQSDFFLNYDQGLEDSYLKISALFKSDSLRLFHHTELEHTPKKTFT